MNVTVSVFHVAPYSARFMYVHCTIFAEIQITIILNIQMIGEYSTGMANWSTDLPSNSIENSPRGINGHSSR
jgi:hypothetical protein